MLNLSKPCIPEEALAAVAEVLRSGQLVQGSVVAEFETALARYLGAMHAVAVSSGTAALHLALLAAGIGPGDEVVVPAFTYPATANVVAVIGARPVLVDVGKEDLCIAPGLIEAVLTSRTKAILVVHEFGQSADLDPILDIGKRHGLLLIEDAACALGTAYKGKLVGAMGACGCFSFHPRKAITTGEGGLITAENIDLAIRLRALRNHGIVPGEGRPDFMFAGLNYRLTEFQAALGMAQLPLLTPMLKHRYTIAAAYDTALAGDQRIELPKRIKDRTAVYQTYHIVLADDIDRDATIVALRAENIETNLGAQALNCLSFYVREYGYSSSDCPNATRAFEQGLALPMGPHCSEQDAVAVAACLRKAIVRK